MRILLCDDHVLLAEALESLLTAAGHEVTVTPTADAAVQALGRLQPDVAVLDVGFPEGDGLEVLSRTGEIAPSTRVLMLSASRDPELVRTALDLGACGYLCKDVGVAEVIRAVDRVDHGEVVLDPLVVRALAQRPRARLDHVEWLLGFLSPREREVLRRIVLGQSTQEMATGMQVSRSTARTHVQNVLRKLGVHSRLEAVAAVSRRKPEEPAWLPRESGLRQTQ